MKRDELRALLEAAGVRPTRASGQNFLVDENLAQAIARDGVGDDEAAGAVVLEVGTGPGILTELLLPRARHVVTVELDARLAALARERLGDDPRLTLVEADALASKSQLNPRVLEALAPPLAGGAPLRVVANLPYAVATPLVVGLLSERLPLSLMVVMVQLEAAERFAAGVGDPAYGAVSVLCGALCERVKLLRRVPPDVFWPRPKVTSAVVRFDPRPDRRDGFEALAEVVRALFNYRRKTIARAARQVAEREPGLAWVEQAVAALVAEGELDARRRPEDLDTAGFRRIARLAPQ
ncbi:MAG: 16S rRNA (adenine(1518)-N(6)/adenine(1519)-N(6))-dimethyltransferase RsmA [Planctomycetes bacterium]|nr:16S rRNA (adenine(1518)-N(6)/adenine(1519)-N(6))-dimethyltransferase RsmA [Planctomycetota bacterium]